MNLIFQISLILLSVTFLGVILRYLKQPLILAYVLAGILLGPSLLNISVDANYLSTSLTVCLSVVLFIYGLKLNTQFFSYLGNSLFISYLIQFVIFFSLMLVFFISVDLNIIESLVLSFAMSFSSTILTVRLLDDKKDTNNLYGKISLGFTTFQAIFFVITFFIFQNFIQNSNSLIYRDLIEEFVKLLVVVANIYLVSRFLLPRFAKFISSSDDFLVLFSISWALVVIGVFKYLNLPYELGALVSSIFLASQSFADRLYEKFRSIKDLFTLILFTIVGLSLDLGVFQFKFFLIVLLVLFLYFVRGFLISLVLRLLSFSRRVTILSFISYNHIGELSILLLTLNFVNFDSDFKDVFNFLFILSAIISSYSLHYSEKLQKKIGPLLGFYLKELSKEEKEKDIVVFGCGINGFDFLNEFKNKHFDFVGVDYNPEVVEKLKKKKFNLVFGDAEDTEVYEKLQISKAQLVVSTITDFDTNKFILNELRERKFKGVKIVYSSNIEESVELYRLGASFVVLPSFLSSHKVAQMAADFGGSHSNYESEKIKHLEIFNKKLIMSYDYK